MRDLHPFDLGDLCALALTGMLCVALFAGAAHAQDCKLKLVASLPMSPHAEGGVTVPMTIEGTKANLLVDTAGAISMLTDKTVGALSLRRDASGDATGGDARLERVALSDDPVLKLFGKRRLKTFAVAETAGAAARQGFMVFPADSVPDGVDGTLAPDILSAFDVEIDPQGGKLNLFSQNHCDGQDAYWANSADVAAVPFVRDENGRIVFDVAIDGKRFAAALDTASAKSSLSFDAAQDGFGWGDAVPRLVRLAGDNAGFARYPFGKIEFEGVALRHPRLLLTTDAKGGWEDAPDLVIGMSVLSKLHSFISFREKKLYFTAVDAH